MADRGAGRVDLAKQRREIERLRREMAEKPPAERRVVLRAVVRIREDLHLEARVGTFRIEADEPLARGGTELAPSPLQYLTAAIGF